MLQYIARITSQEPFTEELRGDLSAAIEMARSSVHLATGLQQDLGKLEENQGKLETASLHISNIIQGQVCNLTVYGISDSGYVDIREPNTCPVYRPGVDPGATANVPWLELNTKQIRLTLRSDFDALKRQVDSLSARLAQLEAATRITPQLGLGGLTTLYPKYNEWILISDAKEQYLSFSGLRAEIGRSIYIQTRKRAYLYANNHSFFGLPGTSVSQNQWLANNTTYRFVRASSDSWLVTSSSSPYPWT